MLSFSPIKLSDREEMDKYLLLDGDVMTDRSFSALYIWQDFYRTRKCVKDGMLYLTTGTGTRGVMSYMVPLGAGNLGQALGEIAEHAKTHGEKYVITSITPAKKEQIEAICPDRFTFFSDRDYFDYIYSPEDLTSLVGKKFHSKRNFINRFKNLYNGRWAYTELGTERDGEEICAFLDHWNEQKSENADDYAKEIAAITRGLYEFSELGLLGGVLRLDGSIIAFTMASPMNADTMDVMIEKADQSIDGAYQMINNQFAIHNFSGFKYINREEDLGIEGLRKAKLSYHPVFLSERYHAVPNEV